jgi:hypothetical protein
MELNKFELILLFFKLLIMDNLKQQFPYVDNEILDLANVKDKMILKELAILNTEREKVEKGKIEKEKYKAESINKCLDLERQLSEALFELNYLKERITKEKEIKEKEIKDYVSSDL